MSKHPRRVDGGMGGIELLNQRWTRDDSSHDSMQADPSQACVVLLPWPCTPYLPRSGFQPMLHAAAGGSHGRHSARFHPLAWHCRNCDVCVELHGPGRPLAQCASLEHRDPQPLPDAIRPSSWTDVGGIQSFPGVASEPLEQCLELQLSHILALQTRRRIDAVCHAGHGACVRGGRRQLAGLQQAPSGDRLACLTS